MKTPRFLTKRFLSNFIRFIAYFAVIIISPFIGDFLGGFFNRVFYGQWVPFFSEMWECVIWLLAINSVLIINAVCRKNARKKAALLAAESEETQTETQTPAPAQKCVDKLPERLAEKKERWRGPLPLKNVWIMAGLCALAVLIFTLQIGFHVKPFYEIGEKNTASELVYKVMLIGQDAVKCGWIVLFMRAALAMSEEIFASLGEEKRRSLGKWLPWLVWIVAGGILACFGVYDVLVYSANFALTYAFLYILFPVVYYLSKECGGRAYLVILFIYLF